MSKVTKCICHDRSFEALQQYAQKHNLTTVEELQDHDMCSNGCGLCIPYVEMMLRTGQITFSPGEPYRTKRTGE